MTVVFEHVPAAAASDTKLRQDLLDTWVAVTDAGGSVGFTPPAPVAKVATALDAALARVVAGADVLGVLRAEGRAVGMGMLVDGGAVLKRHWRTVLRVMVHPEHQGNGAGRVLMTGLHGLAADLGLDHLMLTVRGGEGLEGFYERFGYRIVGAHPRAIRVSAEDYRDEVMLVATLSAG